MSSPTSPPVTITAVIRGRKHARADVLRWEDRRITAAAKKIGVAVPAVGSTAERREALLNAKLELGSAAIIDRLSRDVRITDFVAKKMVALSTQRSLVVSELDIIGGSATQFVDWFNKGLHESDEAAMLRACPDHFVLRTGSDGRQEVLQATGSSPLATRFFLDYGKTSTLTTPRDASFTHEISAIAQLADGTLVGGARLQFADTDRGFRASLIEELPRLSPPNVVAQQRWHCVCEFSNWIEAAHK